MLTANTIPSRSGAAAGTSPSLRVVILGCGRVGAALARQLAQEGHAVAIVDLARDAFRRLGTHFKGQRVVGTGLDQSTLKQAGIDQADIFIAVTQGDNTNIMAAQVARDVFQVARVIARIYDPIRAQEYREMGINTLCTTTLAAGLIRSEALGDAESAPWRDAIALWDKRYLDQAD